VSWRMRRLRGCCGWVLAAPEAGRGPGGCGRSRWGCDRVQGTKARYCLQPTVAHRAFKDVIQSAIERRAASRVGWPKPGDAAFMRRRVSAWSEAELSRTSGN